VIIGETPLPGGALGVDAVAMTMRFGEFVALDNPPASDKNAKSSSSFT
jgi:hypothetical protein